MTELISNMHETEEWPKDFTGFSVIALKKKPKATKCSDHRTVGLIANTAKAVMRMLRRRIGRKIADVLGDNQCGFRRGKGTGDAIWMQGVISERTLDTDEELRLCFMDWQKPFDRVNWTKLMQILKVSVTDWRKRELNSKLYIDQNVKRKLDQGETRRVKIGREVRQRC